MPHPSRLLAPLPARRRLLLGTALLPLTGLAGCAAFDYSDADAPVALERVPVLDPRPDIALVLGSGGPRGYAHIGVLRVLARQGYGADVVSGGELERALAAGMALMSAT